MKNFLFASALFLNAIGVSIENFEHGQWLLRLRQLAREMKRRRERHHGVEADVIFTAESTGVGDPMRMRCSVEI